MAEKLVFLDTNQLYSLFIDFVNEVGIKLDQNDRYFMVDYVPAVDVFGADVDYGFLIRVESKWALMKVIHNPDVITYG